MSHTPGPWSVETDVSPFYTGIVAIVQAAGHESISITAESGYVPKSDWRPNAQLMAAAPDLLSAAESVLALAEELRDEEAYLKLKSGLDALEEATKKARGEI